MFLILLLYFCQGLVGRSGMEGNFTARGSTSCLSISDMLFPYRTVMALPTLCFFPVASPSYDTQTLTYQLLLIFIHSLNPFHWWLPHDTLYLDPALVDFSQSCVLILATCPNHLRAPHHPTSYVVTPTPNLLFLLALLFSSNPDLSHALVI